MATKPILLIAGTNRPGSNARRVQNIVKGIYGLIGEPVELYGLDEMPPEIFDPRSYAQKPASFAAVQQRVLDAKGLHLITPEYNGGFPGVLKYFIDMLKFPESFEHKPVALIGEAAGIWGGIRPVEQLQHIFGYRNAYIFPERVFLPRINEKFDTAGNFNEPDILQKLQAQVAGFISFTNRLTTL